LRVSTLHQESILFKLNHFIARISLNKVFFGKKNGKKGFLSTLRIETAFQYSFWFNLKIELQTHRKDLKAFTNSQKNICV